MKADKLRPGRAWFTRSEVAAAFDVTLKHVDGNLRRFAPADKVKTVGTHTFIHLRSLLDGWKAAGERQTADSDPLLVGGDSPALEEYRKHRARTAKVEADEREKLAVPRAELEPVLMQSAGVIRRAGETLARRFGNEAADIHNEAVDQLERTIHTLLIQLGNDANAGLDDAMGAVDEDAPAAHPARVR